MHEALRSQHFFDQLREDLILHFTPRRMFGRLQRYNHVEDIQEAASVLRLSLSESQVVANIIDGLSPSRRSRLVSQQVPVSYEDLSRLCVHDHNIRI